MTVRTGDHCCFILPPVILARVAEEGSAEDRAAALKTLSASTGLRSRRSVVQRLSQEMGASLTQALAPKEKGERRSVYDAKNGGDNDLPGDKIRVEGGPESDDTAVNEAYDGAGSTYDFFKSVLGRTSIDDEGMELISSVHFGVDFDNAFWQGSQMVYGDGSGRFLARGSLTSEISVIAHELTHGVTQFTAGLIYSKQSGALNESFSDVFGSLVKQHGKNETATKADWLIGEGILGPAMEGNALRSMKAPGTAFKFDNQPANMADFQDLPDDNDPNNDRGGVHINSGIPNKAFYLVATNLGGHAWDKAGPIWYDTLTKRLRASATFVDAAEATIESATELFDEATATVVREAWQEVGVLEPG